ncbi:DUF2058 domain-containing protein [Sedimenticola sp.]|uniref:DUF2058 domain-containing protein n=1 Tax=Sedimenticola sp. TaxID=1940285 RepID=UPI003D0ADD05
MGISLQDQLLKAGLVDKKKASEVRKEKQKQAKQQRKGQAQSVDQAKLAAQAARREQAERDRQLNLQRKAEADKRALQAQIRQLIEMNQVSVEGGELPYSFTDGNKIKKLYVTEQVQSRLSRGQLAIARFDDRYAVVPIGVAEKIAQRDSLTIVLKNDPVSESDEDDPYADFQVPDDLMW